MRANEFGIFFYSAGPDEIPFGPNGYLCVAQPLIRLSIRNSGPAGILVEPLDLNNLPQAWGEITAGSTWYFQSWFRDPISGADTSDGLSVLFTP